MSKDEEEQIQALIEKLSDAWKEFDPSVDTIYALVDDVTRAALASLPATKMPELPSDEEITDKLEEILRKHNVSMIFGLREIVAYIKSIGGVK